MNAKLLIIINYLLLLVGLYLGVFGVNNNDDMVMPATIVITAVMEIKNIDFAIKE